MHRNQQTLFYGISAEDVQRIIQETVRKHAKLPGIVVFDASYLYNFHLDDFDYVRKFNLMARTDKTYVFAWHSMLERWLNDQTVNVLGKIIKPIKIVRSFDRVPNEGLEMLARCLTGEEMMPIQYHGLGNGARAGDEPLPSDTQLVNQISRINVTTSPEGGSLHREGSTIYINGNHPKGMESGDITEIGAWDAEHTDHDLMIEHSIFPSAVPHAAGADSAGGTIVIYMCSS
jgi:hypothetical protein